ncbi:hypothetical protein Leryth_014935 [Lithospermum erythrorhizon]|nr:hypothetical protein Leryth_014935 [Lithospermum erythrorhizon]
MRNGGSKFLKREILFLQISTKFLFAALALQFWCF